MRVLEKNGADHIRGESRLCFAHFVWIKPPPPLVSPQRLGLFLGEGRLQALLEPVLDIHRAEPLDPRDQLGKHLEAVAGFGFGLRRGARGA